MNVRSNNKSLKTLKKNSTKQQAPAFCTIHCQIKNTTKNQKRNTKTKITPPAAWLQKLIAAVEIAQRN